MKRLLKVYYNNFIFLFLIISASYSNPDKKLNIVFIIAEDISTDLGCNGRTDLKTPNLDNLSNQGLTFNNAFTTSPVCSPSRSSIMTGMYQNSIGAHNHRSETGSLKNGIVPFTHHLRNAGYFTCNVDHEDYGNGKTDFNFYADNLFDGNDWDERKEGQPFFAQISIYTTHRDTHWYGIEKKVSNPVNPEKVSLPPYYPDHFVSRLDWARYLNSIQYMDAQVGKIVARLEKEGLIDNTVIIFIGDHGRCHIRGKQWLYDSGIKIPFIMKFPDKYDKTGNCNDLVSAIDVTATILQIAGVSTPEYMEGRSILAKDYIPRQEIFAARDRCDAVLDKIRCVRTDSFKYIKNYMPELPYTQFGHYKEFYYPMMHLVRVLNKKEQLNEIQQKILSKTKEPEELYNIVDDPEETNNLALHPEYREILEDLRKKLEKWEIQTGDIYLPKESEEFMEQLHVKREKKYMPKWEERGVSPFAPAEEHLAWWEKNLEVYKICDNQPLEKPGAAREIFKIIERDTLYVYLNFPENHITDQKNPAIVFFHGGGWRRGKSSQFDKQCQYLASRGMVAIQADYRVMMRDSITPFECVMDGKAAIRWIRKNAVRFGIDPDKIIAGGGSAGGHIAAACGHISGLEHKDEDLNISSKPNALVLFNPVFDNGPNGYRNDLFGDNYKKISPLHNVTINAPPAIVMVGDKDDNISVSSVKNYQHKMDSVGSKCVTKIYPGQKHGFFNMGKGGYKMYSQTVYDMDEFLIQIGYLKNQPTIDLNNE